MPDFDFTSPDGKTYTVSGPPGATSAQAFQMLQAQLSGKPPEPESQYGTVNLLNKTSKDIDQANKETGNMLIGPAETALNAATGIGSSIVGGFRGLAQLATGGSLQDAVKASQDTQHNYTYEPRTGIGKLGTDALQAPLVVAKDVTKGIGGAVGEAINGEQGRIAGESIGDVVPDVAATLLGGRAIARGAAARAPEPLPAPDVWRARPPTEHDVWSDRPASPEVPIAPAEAPRPQTGLESYAERPMRSPYGELIEPQVPPVDALKSALDEYAARAGNAPQNPITPPRMSSEYRFDDVVRESPIDTPMKSPLDRFAEGSPAEKITAGLRDTSDIDAALQKFGVDPVRPSAAPAGQASAAPSEGNPAITSTGGAGGRDRPPLPPTPEFSPTPERHVDPARREQNLRALHDIGLDNVRESAITGDAATAAREFQHGKFTSEQAGQLFFDQFEAETNAMKSHAQKLIDETGGKTGLDSESLEAKGRDIAAPYDAARQYFEAAKKNLYDMADKELGGAPLQSTAAIDNLLVDRKFNNTALADGSLDLVRAIKNQFELHKERNADGMTIREAEDFRKWLNARWKPDNAKIIGEVKNALDDDVFKSAGKDVYEQARRMHQLEKRTLDNPNGIAKIMDSDPYTPINRNTAYENIPNAMIKLTNEQFKHIIDTYKDLPPELQPLAQQAIATLRAHYAERFLNSGAETSYGNGRQLWNSGGVKKFVTDNSAKLPMVFDAAQLQQIEAMLKAGEILKVNPTYPGAAAQAANASKAGLMSHLASRAGGALGGGAGAVVGGVPGAIAGAATGEVLGSRFSKGFAERKALADAKAAIISRHVQKPPPPRGSVEDWEAPLR